MMNAIKTYTKLEYDRAVKEWEAMGNEESYEEVKLELGDKIYWRPKVVTASGEESVPHEICEDFVHGFLGNGMIRVGAHARFDGITIRIRLEEIDVVFIEKRQDYMIGVIHSGKGTNFNKGE